MTNDSAGTTYIPIVIGVTGHRDVRDQDRKVLEKRVHDILSEIKSLYPHSPVTLLSPLAEGADRLVAQVALNLGINLVVPLPMPLEEYKKDFESPESLKEFNELLGLAKESFELPDIEKFEKCGENMSERGKKYEQVGAYIARHSQILIALWDGVETRLTASTSRIVDFKLTGIPEPYAPFRSYLDHIENGPVYHVVTPRVSNPRPEAESFSLIKLYPDSHGHRLESVTIYEEILKKIDGYNRDVILYSDRLANEIEQSKLYVIPKHENLSAEAKNILQHYAVADTLSQYFQRKTKLSLIGLLVLVVAAFFSFQLYLEFFKQPLVLFLYPSTLGVAFGWYFFAKRRDFQNKHLDYRAVAEGLRVQLFWSLAGLKEEAADHYLRKQKSEMNWIREAIRITNISKSESGEVQGYAGIENDRKAYGVVLKHWVNEQAAYYTKATERDEKRLRKQERMSSFFYWLGLGLAVAMLIFHNYLHEFELIHHVMVVSIAMALAIAAALQGHIEKAALSEHVKQYERMRDLFAFASRRLEDFLKEGKLSEARHLIAHLGEEALRENGDWVLLHRARPIGVPKG